MNSAQDVQSIVLTHLLQSDSPSHLITLNPNRHVPGKVMPNLLRLFALNVVSRLFRGSITRRVPEHDNLSFFGCMEFTSIRDIPHYHLLARVNPNVWPKLERACKLRWQGLIPGGHCDVRPITQTPEDLQRVAEYVSKSQNEERCFAGFRSSRELDLPAFCHSREPVGTLPKTSSLSGR